MSESLNQGNWIYHTLKKNSKQQFKLYYFATILKIWLWYKFLKTAPVKKLPAETRSMVACYMLRDT